MTEGEARMLVAVALGACPTQATKLGRDQVEAMGASWALLLADLEYHDAEAALRRWLGVSHWLPAPAQLRRIVAEERIGRPRTGADAWSDVLAAIRRVGQYRVPTFEDPIVARLVRQLGWVELCRSEHLPSDRARFIDGYDREAVAAFEDATVHTLPGAAAPALPAAAPKALPPGGKRR